jgi:hypothetical protein
MAYQYGNSQYSYPPGSSNDQYAQQQQQQQYQAGGPPVIRNPFAPPPAAQTGYVAQSGGYDPEYEAQLANWQSAYAPQDQQLDKKGARAGRTDNPNLTQVGSRNPVAAPAGVPTGQEADGEKKLTVVRKGGGQTWEDATLVEWDPAQFRIMVGNLAGEVTDDSLAKAFAQYGVSKARVIRDKRTTKSRGFGFVSFTDGELGFKAAREMVGKYIGSHPVTIQRSKTDLRPTNQKDRFKGKHDKRNRDKKDKKQDDPLRANTGASIEKKPVKNAGAYKVIG